jgi:3-deoxy-manno-octulosonate cytidylyltransferase (CMP-KDO synthetase)
MMKAIGIIPARLAASRFPGKPLAHILGMPMVGHCYHRTRLVPGLDATYVATCDLEIADYVQEIGGQAVMTSMTHTRASTRTAEALEIIEKKTIEKKKENIIFFKKKRPYFLEKTKNIIFGKKKNLFFFFIRSIDTY